MQPGSVEHRMRSLAEATRVRDALILQGVESAVTSDAGQCVLVSRRDDESTVVTVIAAVRSAR